EGGAHGPSLDYNPTFPTEGTSSITGLPMNPSQSDQIAAWERLRAKNAAAIDATSYRDWVPLAFTKDGSGVNADTMSCNDFYVRPAGSPQFGVTQLQPFDLAAPAKPPSAVAIVGAAETVYGNASSMVLAGRAYTDPWVLRQSYVPTVAGNGTPGNGTPV